MPTPTQFMRMQRQRTCLKWKQNPFKQRKKSVFCRNGRLFVYVYARFFFLSANYISAKNILLNIHWKNNQKLNLLRCFALFHCLFWPPFFHVLLNKQPFYASNDHSVCVPIFVTLLAEQTFTSCRVAFRSSLIAGNLHDLYVSYCMTDDLIILYSPFAIIVQQQKQQQQQYYQHRKRLVILNSTKTKHTPRFLSLFSFSYCLLDNFETKTVLSEPLTLAVE